MNTVLGVCGVGGIAILPLESLLDPPTPSTKGPKAKMLGCEMPSLWPSPGVAPFRTSDPLVNTVSRVQSDFKKDIAKKAYLFKDRQQLLVYFKLPYELV